MFWRNLIKIIGKKLLLYFAYFFIYLPNFSSLLRPLLKNDEGAELENLLMNLLPQLKRTEVKVPWSKLRKMNKEERLAARRAAQAEIVDDNYNKTAAYEILVTYILRIT